MNIFVDGASRGNPGPAAIGIHVVYPDGHTGDRMGVVHLGQRSKLTNNEAEYLAVFHALKLANQRGWKEVAIHTDSKLVFHQLHNRWKITVPNLKRLKDLIIALANGGDTNVLFDWVSREEEHMRIADKLCNRVLDLGGGIINMPEWNHDLSKPLRYEVIDKVKLDKTKHLDVDPDDLTEVD